MKALTVTEPFADYAKGDQITDAKKIADVLASNPGQVVNVIIPDPDTKAPAAAPDAPQA